MPIKKRKINVDFYPSSGSDFDNDDPLGENKDHGFNDGTEFGTADLNINNDDARKKDSKIGK